MSDGQFSFNWNRPEPESPSAALPGRDALRQRLQQLAAQGIYLGTSSWKYPGWLGKVYEPGKYLYRGKFSKKNFDQRCLEEYAHVFPTVCGDFAFYQFPSPAMWQRTFEQLPEGYKFSLKIPEDITVETYPDRPRYGQRAGRSNAHFMDAALLREQLLRPLEPYRDRLGVLIFQFGTIHDGPMSLAGAFAARLGKMLSQLPTAAYHFAVEVRNPAFLREGAYFECLKNHRTAHCLNSWTRMPSIAEQLQIPEVFTAEHVTARFLLRPGRSYQQAVEQFSPYERVQEPYPEGNQALRDLIERCLEGPHTLFAFVNNRFEGNAVETIESVV